MPMTMSIIISRADIRRTCLRVFIYALALLHRETRVVGRSLGDGAGVHADAAGARVDSQLHTVHGARRGAVHAGTGVVVGGTVTRAAEPALAVVERERGAPWHGAAQVRTLPPESQ